MTPTTAVFRREFAARRELLLMAVGVAICISLLPLLPNIESNEATDVRTVGSSVSAMAFGWVLALLLGATVFGSDLSTGRVGFFLARPVSCFAVWWGKVFGAMALIWIVEIIVLVPALYGEGLRVFTSFDGFDWLITLGYVVAPFILFLLAHAVSVMLRARTAFLVLDLIGFFACAAAIWTITAKLFFLGAMRAFAAVGGAVLLVFAVALAVAGLAGLAAGRSDLRRTHAALSISLWSIMAIGIASAALATLWLWDFGADDLRGVEIYSVAPDGEWIDVMGYGERRLDVSRRFLVSTVDSRSLALPSQSAMTEYGSFDETRFSRDGSTALWVQWVPNTDERSLWWADLRSDSVVIWPSNVVVSARTSLTLSANGARFALLDGQLLSIYELVGDRLIKVVHLPKGLERATVFFYSPERLRLMAINGDEDEIVLQLADVDVATGSVAITGQVTGLSGRPIASVDGELQRMVIWGRQQIGRPRFRRMVDARDGTLIGENVSEGFPRFLGDGRRVEIQEGEGSTVRLVVHTVARDSRIVHELGRHPFPRLIGEVETGVVALTSLIDETNPTDGRRVFFIDVETGRSWSPDASVRRGFWWAPLQTGKAGSFFWEGLDFGAFRFFEDQSGAIVRWDPGTGKLVHVIG